MKTNKTIVLKISIASIAFMMLAGFSVSQAAENQHAKGDSDKRSRNHRNERSEPQHQNGDHMGRGVRGGPRVENHQSKDFPFQKYLMHMSLPTWIFKLFPKFLNRHVGGQARITISIYNIFFLDI